ncbi:MAG: hypothetical protein LBP22_07875 [Deltaproteobacteria bacterium]|nr:hypothetical protein [Deltaproteobacteria bacterium]
MKYSILRKSSLFLFCLALAWPLWPAGSSLAQQRPPAGAPNIGSAVQEVEGARPQVQPRREDPGFLPEESRTEPIPARPGEPTIFVAGFRLDNPPFLKQAEVQAALAPYVSRSLTMEQLEDAADQVSELYRKKGYLLTRAYLPAQNSQDGIILLEVLVGRFGGLSLRNGSLVRDSRINAALRSNMPEGEPVTLKALERTALLISDIPGTVTPRLNMDIGEKPGTSDFFAEAFPDKRLAGFFMLDNMGSRYTGRWRFGAGLDVNSLTGFGDKLSFFGLITENGDLGNISLTYAFPRFGSGLNFEIGFSHVRYELGKEFKDIDATGTSNIVSGTISYPVIRSTDRNLTFSLGLFYKKLEDEMEAFQYEEKKSSVSARLGLTYENWTTMFSKNFYWRFDGGLIMGKLRMPAGEAKDWDRAGRKTLGDFQYVSLGLQSYLALTEKLNLGLGASSQMALAKNLDSSEQFNITGDRGVKAYREAISSDNGWLVGAELNYTLPSPADGFSHTLGAFYDIGGWSRAKPPYGLKSSDTLKDIGLSYTINYKDIVLRVRLVRGLGEYPSELRRESDTYVSTIMMMSF